MSFLLTRDWYNVSYATSQDSSDPQKPPPIMNKTIFGKLTLLSFGVIAATAPVAQAQQENAAPNTGDKVQQQGNQANNDEETLNQLLGNGNGVANPKYDESGALKSAHIVVKVPLTKSLPEQFAKNAARKMAGINSKSEFVKWLKTNCRTEERGGELVVISVGGQDDGTTGQGGGSAQAKQEMGSVTENTAQGLAVGIISLKEAVIGNEYVGIFGWSKRLVAGAQSVEQAQSKSDSAQSGGAQSGAQGGATSGGAPRPGGAFQGVAPVKPSAKGINDF